MYKGFILSESLSDPTLLNQHEPIYVQVQKHPESQEYPFWHCFKISVADEKIDAVVTECAAGLKRGWYAHFWNDTTVLVALKDKVFALPRESKWQSKAYLDLKSYALEHGIAEHYLGFWIEE